MPLDEVQVEEKNVDGPTDPNVDGGLSQISPDSPLPNCQKRKHSMQLLQFDKSHRPPFYGVWPRKRLVLFSLLLFFVPLCKSSHQFFLRVIIDNYQSQLLLVTRTGPVSYKYCPSDFKLMFSSRVLGGRCPFRKDPDIDYEIDSDEEWEEVHYFLLLYK